MIRRTLIPVAVGYIAGIVAGAFVAAPLVPLFAISGALGLLCLAWRPARRVSLAALLFLAGWINLAQHTSIVSPHDLRSLIGSGDQEVLVRGELRETPYHRAHVINNLVFWSSMARIEVSEVRLKNGDWQPAYGTVMSSTKEFLPDAFYAGQTVEVSGVLRPPPGALAEGLFDYRNYLSHQGIYYELGVKKVDAWQIISSPARPPLADRFCAWARKAIALGLPAEDESLRLEWALTLGWKAALTDQVAEPFIKAATYHIFAVDGLRIAIIAAILLGLLRIIGIPRVYCGLLAAPVILFYAAMTGWPASAIRAIVMILIVFIGWALARPSDLINSLFAAAVVILLWQPSQFFQAGFQLSFFVVLCIILILPCFKLVGERVFAPDPLRPESLEPYWQKVVRWFARNAIDLFLTSLAAWVGSIPLVALYFHIVTPLSGPANMLAVPLCALVLICNLTSLLFAGWFPWVAVVFNHAGWFCMECIRATSKWSAHWPGAYFYVAMPDWFFIALYYFILIAALTGWLFRGRWRWKVGGASVLLMVWCGLWLRERPAATLTVLPLTGGQAIYVRTGNGGGDWLLDCGSESEVEEVVKPFLEAQGVNRLDNLVLTHGEIGYSGGAELTTELFAPRNIYSSAAHFRSPEYRKFEAENHAGVRAPLKPGDAIGPWKILYPPPGTPLTKADDNAMVLLGEINHTRVLLLSDLSHTGQNALLAQHRDELRADIVIAGVPGEGEPFSEALLDAAQPRAIVVADSRQPANKKAADKLKQRLARRNVPIFYTSASDAVTLTVRPEGWEVRAMDGDVFKRGD